MNKGGTFLILLAVLAGAVFWWTTQDDEPEAAAAGGGPVAITYQVRGTADAVDITIETPDGTSQQSEVSVPLRRKPTQEAGLELTFQPGDFVYISAQNTGDSGSVTCRIDGSGGETIAETTSTGPYAIATCDGLAR